MEPLRASRSSDNVVLNEAEYQRWQHWPVNWTAVGVGALAAFAVSVLFGLSAVALGAHELTPNYRIVDLRKAGMLLVTIGVIGSFFAFVTGGWIAGKIAGILHSEPAILHGAIVWLTAIPLIIAYTALGANGLTVGWLGGLGNAKVEAPFVRPEPLPASATEQARAGYDADWAQYRRDIAAWNAETPRVARNAALCAVSALLLGLMGAVIGGWLSSGEPMSPRYRRVA